MINAARDWHGVERLFLRTSDGAVAPTLRALAQLPLALDARGIATAWGHAAEYDRTVLADVRSSPCRHLEPTTSDWAVAFTQRVADIARRATAPVLALGGGLDGAAVLAAWRESGMRLPAVATLATGLPSYDEVDAAQRIAAAFGTTCEVVAVAPAQLVELLPQAIATAETALYNLHPLSRLALALGLKTRGYTTLITGDGADAAFRGRPDLDYIPIVAALSHAAGVALASPFFDDAVVAAILGGGGDSNKQRAREYLAQRSAPEWLCTVAKQPRAMPDLDLSRYTRAGESSSAKAVTLNLLLRYLRGDD